jgi:hypothetical protein
MLSPNELVVEGIQAHLAAIVCRCGWMTVEFLGANYYCDNPACINHLKLFRAEVQVFSLPEVESMS